MSFVSSAPRTALWSAGLVALVMGGCLLVGCLEPLVAVAVVAAGALPMGRAILLTLAVWVAGQAIGFGLHDYPRDPRTIAWGVGLGVAALAALAGAAPVLAATAGKPTWLRAGLAFVAAFVANQLVILGVEQAITGACEIRPGVISLVGGVNAAWLAGLLALDAGLRRLPLALPGFGRPA
ncbi:MAG: hypothetical protein KJ775_01955 [Alphaproteobacteria bacterium]|nr:hypothetical protein [Alphaproteobacteria bacterium]MBU1516133.1 hypothetical protein [Alphaproteobacteria bacterium]MBU2092652.1 hypothetical protein [Alphaproteobacteria bacterium]MBU2308451.1 hypothetical protein [Alphaproteobacteria bacterium]